VEGGLTVYDHISQVQPRQGTSRGGADNTMKHQDSHEDSVCRSRVEHNVPIGAYCDCSSNHLCTESTHDEFENQITEVEKLPNQV